MSDDIKERIDTAIYDWMTKKECSPDLGYVLLIPESFFEEGNWFGGLIKSYSPLM